MDFNKILIIGDGVTLKTCEFMNGDKVVAVIILDGSKPLQAILDDAMQERLEEHIYK